MKNVFLCSNLTIALLAFCFGPFAMAQELTERERELLRVIEDLERRVTELERVVKGDDGAPAAREPTPASAPATAAPAPQPKDLRVYWQDGMRLDSADGDFKLRIGGRTQVDHALFDLDDSLRSALGDVENGVEFRRARLNVRGTIYENYEFKTQFDFADGSAGFRDVYIAMNNVPYVGQVKAGHFYEPMSLEQQTSDNYITFMERSLQEIFYPGRNVGVAISNTALDQRMTWAAGVYRDTDSIGAGANDSGGMAVTARLTGVPWYEEGGRHVLHLGGAVSLRDPDDTLRYNPRPEAHLSTVRFVDTMPFSATETRIYDGEIAVVYGPFSAQGEYAHVEAKLTAGASETFSGYYAMASYFLTGEHRSYSRSSGAFGRIRPNQNFGFGESKGPGAWELALRISNIDLNDSTIRGGEEDNLTLGLNWYLNPNMRLMFNYTHADVDHDSYKGDVNVLQSRLQVDF